MYEFYKPELRRGKMETNGQSSSELYSAVRCRFINLRRRFISLRTGTVKNLYFRSESHSMRNGNTFVYYRNLFYVRTDGLFPGALRGMGYSAIPMLLSIIGTVGTRIVWIFMIFPRHRSLDVLFISYPASWLITIILQVICYFFVRKRIHNPLP